MKTVQTITDLKTTIQAWRREGKTIAFVPTMGALHEGHLSLVRLAHEKADKVVVSIFVNPKQFNEGNDFSRYPRTEEKDAALLKKNDTDLLYLPVVDAIYPEPFFTFIHVTGVTDSMEGANRPGHFDGVATVVCKLLLQVLPDLAIFGEKDYQQLCLIKTMVTDLNIPVEIIGGKTVRDAEGLALSSRNVFLSEKGIKTARQLNVILRHLAKTYRTGQISAAEISTQGMRALRDAGFDQVDYVALRETKRLKKVTGDQERAPLRLFSAVYLEGVRLIDNIAV